MSDDRFDPRDLWSARMREGAEADEAAAFDRKCLDRLTAAFRMRPKYVRALDAASRRETGDRMTLPWFTDAVSFPLRLHAGRRTKFHKTDAALLSNVFRAFKDAPFVRDYEAAYADAPDGVPVGLVFPFKGVRGGLVLHNAEGLHFTALVGTALVHRGDSPRRPPTMILQPYAALLDGLYAGGEGWRPPEDAGSDG